MLSEQKIFEELSLLCEKKGFIHTLAEIWFRDNYYISNKKGKFTSSTVVKLQANREKLHRNELNTLLALLIKHNPNFFNDNHPGSDVSEQYRIKANQLLENFHGTLTKSTMENMIEKLALMHQKNEAIQFSEQDIFITEKSIREAIFYSGDGVYDFQYQDLGCSKYIKDNEWFIKNKGFSIELVHFTLEFLFQFHHKKIHDSLQSTQIISLDNFIYDTAELIQLFEDFKKINKVNIEFSANEIMTFISAFSFNLSNLNDLNKFQKFDDFNPLTAFPFIKLSENNFLLFDLYTLSQAFYETPFFWLSSDDKYKNIASKNRGEFTEHMIYTIFCNVFGQENVWLNVDLYSKSGSTHSKKDKIGEIDVLVNIHGYALVFQAKSKKLTLNSRKGNIQQIDSDFSKSIQHAYNQAFDCSQIILNNNYIAKIDEKSIQLPEINFCVPICVLSEHFPALTMQIRLLLKENNHERISPALVLDVFLLDLMYKTLRTSLEFIHFIHSLSNARENFLANTQIDLLAVHLSKNFLCSEDADMFLLDNGLSAELDLFLMKNRRNIISQEKETLPLSCWYRFHDTYWWQLFEYCSMLDTKDKLKFGLELLQCSDNFIQQYNSVVSDRILRIESNLKQEFSDFTIFLSNKNGLTV